MPVDKEPCNFADDGSWKQEPLGVQPVILRFRKHARKREKAREIAESFAKAMEYQPRLTRDAYEARDIKEYRASLEAKLARGEIMAYEIGEVVDTPAGRMLQCSVTFPLNFIAIDQTLTIEQA